MSETTKSRRGPKTGREHPPLPPRAGQDGVKAPPHGVGHESPPERLTRNRPTGRRREA